MGIKRKEKNLRLTSRGWMVDVSFGKEAGKYKRVRRVFDTKDAALAYLGAQKQKKLLALLGVPGPQPAAELSETIDEFIERFITVHSKDGLRPKTLLSFQTSKNAVLRVFKGRALSSITAAELERYKADRAGDVKPASINRELAFLKILFRKAVEWGAVEKSPAATVKRLREPEGEIRVLTDAEAARLLAAAAPHLRPVLEVLLSTGMRKNEVLKLRWARADGEAIAGASLVDLTRGEIIIPADLAKNHKSRTVPVSPELEDLFRCQRWAPGAPVFPFNEIRRSFTTAARRAGLRGLRLHVLRHTAASRMIEAGIDVVTVSRVLGHSDLKITLRYCHTSYDRMRAAVQALSRIYSDIRQNSATEKAVPVEAPVKSIS